MQIVTFKQAFITLVLKSSIVFSLTINDYFYLVPVSIKVTCKQILKTRFVIKRINQFIQADNIYSS